MLTVAINGRDKKFNIGCRTFISICEILRLLKSKDQQVLLNGEAIQGHDFARTMVKAGDILDLK